MLPALPLRLESLPLPVRYPARAFRPREIVRVLVRFPSNKMRNRWIDGKRSKDVLKGTEMSAELFESRIEVNERLTSTMRSNFSEARHAVRDVRLQRAWVRNGLVFVRRHADTSSIRVRDRGHLNGMTGGPPPPVAASCAASYGDFVCGVCAPFAGGARCQASCAPSGLWQRVWDCLWNCYPTLVCA